MELMINKPVRFWVRTIGITNEPAAVFRTTGTLWEKWDVLQHGWGPVEVAHARALQDYLNRGELGLDRVDEATALAVAATLS